MRTEIVCVPVTDDDQVDHSWGKARTVALATITDGEISNWRRDRVRWDLSKAQATEGAHHAVVARFIRDNDVTMVVAHHMGTGMATMLTKMGALVFQGAEGDARAAATLAVDTHSRNVGPAE